MKSPWLMFGFAVFLVACGFVAFALAGFDPKAKTALIVAGGTGLLMVVCGVMASMIGRSRVVGMIGIHAGLVLPLVYAALFAWRSYSAFTTGGEDKRYLAIILLVMAVGSLAAFAMILATRPPPPQRGA